MDEKKDTMKVDMGCDGIKSVNVNFPSNSRKQREEEKKPKQKSVQKVVSGKVVTRKKSVFKRFMESFIGEDVGSVSSYVIHDVLIPAAKSTITDIVQGGIEMFLYGERKGSRTQRDRGRSYVSYNSYSSSRRDEVDRSRNRARHNFDDIILKSRGEAEEVLSNLVDLIIDYGAASVSDLYALVDITPQFTDDRYGWTDLSSASVSRVRDGYLLNLPRTTVLD